jgi:hypothetical protein
MTIMTHAQAEHELTRVAARFEDWRHRRTTPSAPIPPSLWEQAVSLTMVLSISRVAQGIGVSGGTLKKRCTAQLSAPAAEGPSTALSFVEVPGTPVWPHPPSGTEIELYRPDGARLRIHSHEPHPPLVALVRTFLETPGCSS